MNLRKYRRHILFLADIISISLMFLLTVWALQEHIPLPEGTWWWQWLALVGCNVLFLLAFRCYDSLWRYASSKEYLLQSAALACGNILFALGNRYLLDRSLKCPLRLQFFAMLMTLVVMWMFRFLYRYQRQLRQAWMHNKTATVNLAIIGAGDVGVALVDEIRRDPECQYNVVCFFDDDPIKRRAHVRGIPVCGAISDVVEQAKRLEIREFIVAIPSLKDSRKREILQLCGQTGCRVRVMPGIDQQLTGDTGKLLSQIRDVQATDLLGRETVDFRDEEVCDFLSDKVVMVTGGGGSIGSELCRQI
ncbi:MAG: hypothetical protein IJZ13_00230, partial [Clostridia bacterium]|nr:hypothetical protein [Clostridia bacterium]